jgi:predicted DNA-binding transcriptional regulator AlpA
MVVAIKRHEGTGVAVTIWSQMTKRRFPKLVTLGHRLSVQLLPSEVALYLGSIEKWLLFRLDIVFRAVPSLGSCFSVVLAKLSCRTSIFYVPSAIKMRFPSLFILL